MITLEMVVFRSLPSEKALPGWRHLLAFSTEYERLTNNRNPHNPTPPLIRHFPFNFTPGAPARYSLNNTTIGVSISTRLAINLANTLARKAQDTPIR